MPFGTCNYVDIQYSQIGIKISLSDFYNKKYMLSKLPRDIRHIFFVMLKWIIKNNMLKDFWMNQNYSFSKISNFSSILITKHNYNKYSIIQKDYSINIEI